MKVTKVWFENDRIYVRTDDGRELWQSLLWYPRLREASDAQRADYELEPFGIRWDSIDEDVSFESFGYAEREPENEVAAVFKRFPEINISSLARRIGITQSLLTAYICGAKTPSPTRYGEIERALHEMGTELMAVKFYKEYVTGEEFAHEVKRRLRKKIAENNLTAHSQL